MNEMHGKVSVVIPTLLKGRIFLENLIAILEKDNAVEEIIIVDNSGTGVILPTGKITPEPELSYQLVR